MRHRRRHGRGLRRRYGHSRGKIPLPVLQHNLAKLKRVIRARGGRV